MANIELSCSVCITQRYKYVVCGPRCVAVQDRQTGKWLDDHHAIDERISLAPTKDTSPGIGPWDLVLVHGFGFKIHIGPVLAIHKPDHATRERIAELVALRVPSLCWTPSVSAIGEPG